MNFLGSIRSLLFDYNGRIDRKDFFRVIKNFVLLNLITTPLSIISFLFAKEIVVNYEQYYYNFLFSIPDFLVLINLFLRIIIILALPCLLIKRLRDVGKSPKLILLTIFSFPIYMYLDYIILLSGWKTFIKFDMQYFMEGAGHYLPITSERLFGLDYLVESPVINFTLIISILVPFIIFIIKPSVRRSI